MTESDVIAALILSWSFFARTSSASSMMIQSPVACFRDSFLAAAKSLIQEKSKIFSVNFLAISLVLSVLPVSTMIISSTNPWMERRQRSKFCSSFLTIIQRLRVDLGIYGRRRRRRSGRRGVYIKLVVMVDKDVKSPLFYISPFFFTEMNNNVISHKLFSGELYSAQ